MISLILISVLIEASIHKMQSQPFPKKWIYLRPRVDVDAITGVIEVSKVIFRNVRRGFTKVTNESTPAIDELHVRTHVSFASLTTDGTQIA